jgi:hypothetical protein
MQTWASTLHLARQIPLGQAYHVLFDGGTELRGQNREEPLFGTQERDRHAQLREHGSVLDGNNTSATTTTRAGIARHEETICGETIGPYPPSTAMLSGRSLVFEICRKVT